MEFITLCSLIYLWKVTRDIEELSVDKLVLNYQRKLDVLEACSNNVMQIIVAKKCTMFPVCEENPQGVAGAKERQLSAWPVRGLYSFLITLPVLTREKNW